MPNRFRYISFLYFIVTELPQCVLKDDYNLTLRLTKGTPTDYRNYSFYVDLTILHYNKTINKTDKQTKCGGTIIGKRWILTAAHCFFGMNTDLDIVISGYNDFYNYTKNCTIVTHEDYTRYKDNVTVNDIALIKLENDIDVQKYDITFGKIMRNDQDVLGKQAAIIGTEQNGDNGLMGARLTVIHTTTCQELCKKKKISSEYHICVYNNITTASTCYGDSGGPLLLDEYQIGVNSFTCWDCETSDKDTKPAVFTRTSHYYEWICKIIDGKDEFNEVCPKRSSEKYVILWIAIIVICSFTILLIGCWKDKCKQLQLANRSDGDRTTTDELEGFIQRRNTVSSNMADTNM